MMLRALTLTSCAFSRRSRTTWRTLSSLIDTLQPAEMVDLTRYPIHKNNDESYEKLMKDCRRTIAEKGFCVLPAFLNSTALSHLAKEVHPLVPTCFRNETETNIWNEPASSKNTRSDKELEELSARTNKSNAGIISHGELPPNSAIKRLQRWEHFVRFLGNVLSPNDESTSPIYPLKDELASSVVKVLMDGHNEAWRFSDHALEATIVLQCAQKGGVLNILPSLGPKLRSKDDHAVEAVKLLLDIEEIQVELRDTEIDMSIHELLEDMDTEVEAGCFRTGPFAIATPKLEPGTLLLLSAKTALTSISPVAGRQPMLLAAMRFARNPDFTLSPSERRRLFGRGRASEAPKAAGGPAAETRKAEEETMMWKVGEDGEAEQVQSAEVLVAVEKARREYDLSHQQAPQQPQEKPGKVPPVPPVPPTAGEFAYLDDEADRRRR